MRVFVISLGIISPIGDNASQTSKALEAATCGLTPLSIFPSSVEPPLPSGQIKSLITDTSVPRTHRLALIAAKEALSSSHAPPDAIVIGVTTGGMSSSEVLIKNNDYDAMKYSYHGANTVAHYLARKIKCHGPILTVTTACSSGIVAIKIGMELLKCG